jgi:hypothetical protein
MSIIISLSAICSISNGPANHGRLQRCRNAANPSKGELEGPHFLPTGSLFRLLPQTFEVHVDSPPKPRRPGVSTESTMHASTWHGDSTSILSRRSPPSSTTPRRRRPNRRTRGETSSSSVWRAVAANGCPRSRSWRWTTWRRRTAASSFAARGDKGGKSQTVPLWCDAGTLADLRAWKENRAEHGARERAPFVRADR